MDPQAVYDAALLAGLVALMAATAWLGGGIVMPIEGRGISWPTTEAAG